VDSTGATIDFLLLAKRDAAAAERFLAKALGGIKARRIYYQERAVSFGRASGKSPDPSACDR
jgi:transposase-like protein